MDGQMLDSCPSCFLHSQGTCQLTPNFLKGLIGQKQGLNHYLSPCHFFYDSPNSVVTLGVLTVIVKAGVARSRWRTGVGRISSLFSWFRACMFVSCVNFHSLRVAQTGVNGFCL